MIAMPLVMMLLFVAFAYLKGDCSKSKPSEPTKVCRDGSLYEVTHEGNITIYDRKSFMTCEETK